MDHHRGGDFAVWGVALYETWQGVVRPRFISRAEIDRLAGELIEQYGEDAEEMARGREHRGWYDSDGFEQGKWRRVRKHIRRLQAGDGARDVSLPD